jgi:virginiamycin B lyase
VTFWLAAGALVCLVFAGSVAGATNPAEPTEVEASGSSGGPLTLGPEGALWFENGEKLVRIGGDGKLTEVPLSESIEFPQGIVAGKEGNLWATTRHEVDRISTSGEVTRFRLPKQNETAGQITVAPDGTLWFTVWAVRYLTESSFGRAYVIRIHPDGRMTRFPIPGSAQQRDEAPASIVAGPDGRIWFTDPGLSRVGKITLRGKLTEYRVRLHPEVLAPDGAARLWFVGFGGVGTIDTTGKVRELRAGNFRGLEIGSYHGAVTGPEGLWFIGGATRVMRLTPSGHLDVIRGPGAPAASRIALGPGGSIWISTVSDPIKGVTAAPLLRYAPGFPGVEVQPRIATLRDGRVRVRLSCGGSTDSCVGEARIGLSDKSVSSAYTLAAESEGWVTLALPASERRLLDRRGYDRVSAAASVVGGEEDLTELVLRSAHPPSPRPGRPLVMPFPADIEVDGLARGPDGALWTGGAIGRFNRVTPAGHVSTVVVPGLGSQPSPIGSDSRHNLWFMEYSGYDAEPVLGRLAPNGKLSQVRLPKGPRLEEDAAIGAGGEVWVVRSEYPKPGEIDRVDPNGKVRRFPVGVEAGAIVADGSGGAWFGESGPRLGHITAAGEIRIYHLPHKGFVAGMTLGRHGVVWFTRWDRRHLPPAIGRITPDGRLTEYTLRHVGNPGAILAAPDGNLWFTTEFPRRIGRMTPHGKVKAWRRGAAAAGAIALGPEGNIWFAAGDQDMLAAFHP